jgi:hypothetical protein
MAWLSRDNQEEDMQGKPMSRKRQTAVLKLRVEDLTIANYLGVLEVLAWL